MTPNEQCPILNSKCVREVNKECNRIMEYSLHLQILLITRRESFFKKYVHISNMFLISLSHYLSAGLEMCTRYFLFGNQFEQNNNKTGMLFIYSFHPISAYLFIPLHTSSYIVFRCLTFTGIIIQENYVPR